MLHHDTEGTYISQLRLSVVESFMGSLPFNFVSQHFRGRLFMLSNIGFYVFAVQQHPIKKTLPSI